MSVGQRVALQVVRGRRDTGGIERQRAGVRRVVGQVDVVARGPGGKRRQRDLRDLARRHGEFRRNRAGERLGAVRVSERIDEVIRARQQLAAGRPAAGRVDGRHDSRRCWTGAGSGRRPARRSAGGRSTS